MEEKIKEITKGEKLHDSYFERFYEDSCVVSFGVNEYRRSFTLSVKKA